MVLSRKIVRHGHTDVRGSARNHCWKEICREGSSDAEKGNRFHILHFCKSSAMEVIDPKSLALLD